MSGKLISKCKTYTNILHTKEIDILGISSQISAKNEKLKQCKEENVFGNNESFNIRSFVDDCYIFGKYEIFLLSSLVCLIAAM